MVTTVIGLGFVGLTTALGLAEYGNKVYGIDIDKAKFKTISSGIVPFKEPGLDDVLRCHLGNNFIPTTDINKAVGDSEVIYYCVGTPYGEDGKADLSMLLSAIDETLNAIGEDVKTKAFSDCIQEKPTVNDSNGTYDGIYRTLVIKSTVPPSTAKDVIMPYINGKGLSCPEEIGLCNNPEFLREGHCWEDFIHATRVVIGSEDYRSEENKLNEANQTDNMMALSHKKPSDMVAALYENSGIPVHHVSLNTAEFIKYLSNTSLACLISFANEMSMAADIIGDIDVRDAFKIVHDDERWQTGGIKSYFYPGCGYGGYCLPKDTEAFNALMSNKGFNSEILQAVIRTNGMMSEFWARRISSELTTDDTIGILGLSFNKDSDDVRQSPAANIIRELNAMGYNKIIAYDPIAMKNFERVYPELRISLTESADEVIEKSDVAAIVTAWDEFKNIECTKPLFDCRYTR